MPTLFDAMKTSSSTATVGPKKKTPAMHDLDSSPSRQQESRAATDAGPAPRKRDSTLPHHDSSPTRSQNRKESHLHDGQAHQPRFGRPSRTSWQPRPSIGGSHRSVINSNEDGVHRLQAVENTYRLDPTEGERFNVGKVQRLLDEFLTNYIGGEQYDDAQKCSKMAIQMADIVKERVKKMDFLRRHKIYCHVVIGQNLGQGVQVASRSLWDTANDCSVTATYCNNSLFAVATVFAVYYC